MLLSSLQKALATSTAYPELLEVMDYAVFPPGKMFRPKLVQALSLDLGTNTQDHLHLGSAIELHHAYTLVHDDLPAMDDDAVRRGKPSTHVAYGEWRAILAGDGLLIASFNELSKVQSTHLKELLTLFAWATGPKGLIKGQYLDLSAEGKANFEETVRIHELKTGRLIQVATLGSYLLSTQKPTLNSKIEFMRIGREIGVSFQLLDDLSELTESVSAHEKEINPFLASPAEALRELENSLDRLHAIITKRKLAHLEKMLDDYFHLSQKYLILGLDNVKKNLEESPAALNLNGFNHLKRLIDRLSNS